ncbi:hypothetical protein NUU61_007367 [Penicillium alfredii]|uniref:Uncharacterized protein n=1 Tax=Penicillium alfredii TaxID=1506179 RepID=A0A9W9F2X9_9EURO|nr:uncharacterized protein NUU61_007367 [Penicillium alfredii]KAJ5092497.1 hypothetical protein NUU61_007367 [Penicillium alfredii]
MESFSTVRTFASGDILALANAYYAQGSLSQWGPDGLFNEVLGLVPGASPVIVPIAWDINGLLGHLVFVVNPGMPDAWILRIVLASEFLWLGLHPVGTTDDELICL